MLNKTIFVVEDEADIQELIRYNLLKDRYNVECFDNAEAMLKRLTQKVPDAVLLDIMLPGIDGIEACRRMRAGGPGEHVPLIMLTAKNEEADVVTGLELGADDYMVKPFSPRVLLARLKAVIRRRRVEETISQKPLEIQGICMHPGRHEVTIDGTLVVLTASEFAALYMLADKVGWVFTRYQIIEEVHGSNYPVTDRSVDVMIAGLRKKMGPKGDIIETVRGIGYKFKGTNDE